MTNKKVLFQTVNAIAKVLEGDYACRLKHAFELVKEGRLEEVNTLIDFTTLLPLEQPVQVEQPAKEQPKKKAVKKPNKVENKNVSRGTKKKEDVEPLLNKEDFTLPMVLDNVELTDFLQILIYKKIDRYNKYTKGKTEKGYILKDGIEELSNAQTIQQVQAYTISYLFHEESLRMAKKILLQGNVQRKEKEGNEEETRQAHKGLSNTIEILEMTNEDVIAKVISDSLRLEFNSFMFVSIRALYSTMKMRIKNAISTEQRRIRKFKALAKDSTVNTSMMNTPLKSYSEITNDIALESVLTEYEYYITKLKIDGFKKKEIDTLTGQRNDRKWAKIQQKIMAM